MCKKKNKNAPLIYITNSKRNEKWSRWLICTYVFVSRHNVYMYIGMYVCVKRFSSFRLPVTFDLWLDSLRVQNRTKEKPKESVGGLQGVKFKFVIPHVQVYIKMLQFVRRFQSWPCAPAVYWQESLFNEWCNALYSALCFCFFQLVTSPHVEAEQPNQGP